VVSGIKFLLFGGNDSLLRFYKECKVKKTTGSNTEKPAIAGRYPQTWRVYGETIRVAEKDQQLKSGIPFALLKGEYGD
jgi:hypothetical protein